MYETLSQESCRSQMNIQKASMFLSTNSYQRYIPHSSYKILSRVYASKRKDIEEAKEKNMFGV